MYCTDDAKGREPRALPSRRVVVVSAASAGVLRCELLPALHSPDGRVEPLQVAAHFTCIGAPRHRKGHHSCHTIFKASTRAQNTREAAHSARSASAVLARLLRASLNLSERAASCCDHPCVLVPHRSFRRNTGMFRSMLPQLRIER